MSEEVYYYSETMKIRPRIQRYLTGRVIDIGCGTDKITKEAIGVDVRPLGGSIDVITNQLDRLSSLAHPKLFDSFDVVYSSHCLEHFADDFAALEDWYKLLKIGGVMILYLPDDRHYDNDSNPEHLHRYTLEAFVSNFKTQFDGRMEVVEADMDLGHDKYSFFVVGRKI
jgi:predicted SAM-dependent methyltransferase